MMKVCIVQEQTWDMSGDCATLGKVVLVATSRVKAKQELRQKILKDIEIELLRSDTSSKIDIDTQYAFLMMEVKE